ncbi:MAG TPA: class I SAM-dependent methyltransferase, partial [Myxococcaceae bacterium]
MSELQTSDSVPGKAIPHPVSTRFLDALQQKVDALVAEGRAGKPFEIVMPDHQSRVFGKGEPASRVHLVTARGVNALVSLDDLMICEAYMDGDINITGDLYDLIGYRSLLSDSRLARYVWSTYARTVLLGQVRADKKGIGSHYDITPEFFVLWLDKSIRGYSHAFFNSDDEPLEPAMERKFQYGIDACGIKPGDRVLDIGGGWGSFVQYAGRQGIHVTSVTISEESEKYMKELIQREKLPCTAVR